MTHGYDMDQYFSVCQATRSAFCFASLTLVIVSMQKTAADLATLREEHALLVQQRDALETAYRIFAAEECDMEETISNAKIAKARLGPQQNQRLQTIHEAHKVVLSKEAEIKDFEAEKNPEDEVSIYASTHICDKLKRAHATLFVTLTPRVGLYLQCIFGTALRDRS